MNWLLVKNDLRRNKGINIAVLLFMTFASVLAVLSVIVASQTFQSISELYKKAEPAHFLQMHKGEINQQEIDYLMAEYETVTDWQIVTMINVYGESITVVGEHDTFDLTDSRLDISLVKQNESKDLLLNAAHEKVQLKQGEIGIPVLLRDTYGMEIGDRVIIKDQNVTKEFVITEFVLDSMMNSTMASSTRILVSNEDFAKLSGKIGEPEYLIEVYFTNKNEAADFQTVYENAGLPQNGQAITYTVIFILSALTGIATVFVLLLVSILLIIVSFICVRFTIMATLEEEIHEIGTMKAIGLPFKDIKNIYMQKYRVLAVIGVAAGFLIAIGVHDIFTNHISTTFGSAELSGLTLILAFGIACLIYLLIIGYYHLVLSRLKKVPVVDALVRGEGLEKRKGRVRDGLYKSKNLPVNWLLSFRDVFYSFKNWLLVFSVVAIAVLLMLVPINLLNTMKDPKFITYMGSSVEDILIEIENDEKIDTNYQKVKQVLENDNDVSEYFEFTRVRVQTTDADNELMNLYIDYGEQSGVGLQYLTGSAPKGEKEIALSYLNAEKMGKDTGDQVILYMDGQEQEFVVSGVYQDVTSGGYTAKSTADFSELQPVKYSFSINLNGKEDIDAKADEWSEMIGAGVSVDPMEEFINQTLGGVVNQLNTVVYVISLIGTTLVALVTMLFLKLRLAKDIPSIAVLKAIGFTEVDVKSQYLIKLGTVAVLGIALGIILTALLGEPIVNGALNIASFGIKEVELFVDPIISYVFIPILLFGLVLVVTWIVVKSIRKYNLISVINE